MKQLLLVILIMAILPCAANCQEQASPSSVSSGKDSECSLPLCCKPRSVDFGSQNPGQFGLLSQVTVRNNTDNTIHISQVKTSHACLTATLPQTELEPKEQAALAVVFKPEGLSPGSFNGSVEVYADGSEAILTIPVKASIDPDASIQPLEGWPKPKPPDPAVEEERWKTAAEIAAKNSTALACRPSSFDFGPANSAQFGLSNKFSIKNVSGAIIHVTKVKPSCDNLGVWMPQLEIDPGSIVSLEVFFNPVSLPAGPFQGDIQLFAGADKAILTVVISALVDNDVALRPMENWPDLKIMPEGPTPSITAKELKGMLDEKVPLLLGFFGSDEEFEKERILGAVHANLADVRGWFKDFDRSRKIVLYAAGTPPGPSPAMRSAIAVLRQEMGFKDVSCLAGTIAAWKEAGYSLEHGKPGEQNSNRGGQ